MYEVRCTYDPAVAPKDAETASRHEKLEEAAAVEYHHEGPWTAILAIEDDRPRDLTDGERRLVDQEVERERAAMDRLMAEAEAEFWGEED